ncbi:MAG: response regulator [Proteobacteria bacterium]|nr:response regulator [Pseudomonadota bacterium]
MTCLAGWARFRACPRESRDRVASARVHRDGSRILTALRARGHPALVASHHSALAPAHATHSYALSGTSVNVAARGSRRLRRQGVTFRTRTRPAHGRDPDPRTNPLPKSGRVASAADAPATADPIAERLESHGSASARPASAGAARALEWRVKRTAPARILYVDDDADVLEVVSATLTLTASVQLRCVDSGESALAAMRAELPDLVLLDVMMPGLDGPGTFQRARQEFGEQVPPVIFFTARAMPHELEEYRRLGVLGIIAKPFDPVRLWQQIVDTWQGSPASAPASPARVPPPPTPRPQLFLRRAREAGEALRALVAAISEGDAVALDLARREAHGIRGAGGIFGFPGLTAQAGEIENLLVGIETRRGEGVAPSGGQLAELVAAIDRFRDGVAAAAHAGDAAAPA